MLAPSALAQPPSAPSDLPGRPRSDRRLVGFAGEKPGWQEGLYGALFGLLYGAVSPVIGHPFDTLKTQLQARNNGHDGTLSILRSILRRDGIVGLYRGFVPPFLGSLVFRSLQFGVYGAVYAALRGTSAEVSVPFTAGTELRVFLGGAAAGAARSCVETPLELMKTRRQTGGQWRWEELGVGARATLVRNVWLLASFFVFVDVAGRTFPDAMADPICGPLLKGSVCSTLAWTMIWPFDVAKTQIQAAGADPKVGVWGHLLAGLQRSGMRGL